MFHPYSIQGGTATVDPQIAGMNGQSRIPEMFGNPCIPNYAGGFPFAGLTAAPVTGVPIAQPVGYPQTTGAFGAVTPTPFGYATTPYSPTPTVNPFVSAHWNPYPTFAPMIPGVNTVPGWPFVNSIPATPVVNPIGAHPFINPFTGTPVVNSFPTAFSPTFFPPVTTLIPTTAGLVPVTVPSINPFLNNPYAWTNYPFRHPFLQSPVFPPIGSTGAGPLPVSPFIDPISLINACAASPASIAGALTTLNPLAGIAAACNPLAGSVLANPIAPSLATPVNPLASINNPFAANAIWNSIYSGVVSPSLHHIYNTLTGMTRYPSSLQQGYSPWASAAFGAGLGHPWINHIPLPIANPIGPGLAGNPFLTTVCNTGVVNPGLGVPMINPINGTTNPFFSPTNIAYGVPGFPAVVPTHTGLSAASIGCGPVCCN